MESSEPVTESQTELRRRGEALVSLPDSEFEQALKDFNASADDCDYDDDSDGGALVLEAVADARPDARRRRQLYSEALRRAERCASRASSGGEGLARSIGVKRIAHKLAGLA